MNEYVECKIERDLEEPSLRMTQPAVLLQSFEDEFDLSQMGKPSLPAPAGSTLSKGNKTESEAAPLAQQTYRKGVGKLLHVTRWTRPDIMNSVRELSRFAGGALMLAHMKAMYRCMAYCVASSKRRIKIVPNIRWNGSPDFKVVISGRADSDYAKDLDTRRSVSGIITFLCGAVITLRSKIMMPMVALSVTEAELFAAVMTVQDMLFIMRIVESMGLQVEKQMLLEIDNKGAKDLINNWSVGGRLRHIEVKQFFLRELKEQGLIVVKWLASEDNTADMMTKNLGGHNFVNHDLTVCGNDEYYAYN
jgi:hypothetical protein